MRYWLLKTEAEEFSIDDLKKKKKEPWTGVRNFVARNHMLEMKKGDLCFIYHTGDEKAIVGLSRVASEAYADPSQFDKKSEYYDETSPREKPKWMLVDIAFEKKFEKTVTLSQIKNDPKLPDMVLAKVPRLSVQPVSATEFEYICRKTRSSGGTGAS